MRRAARRSRTHQILRFADFEADLRAGELRRDNARIRLQDQPFQVLKILLQHPGEVVTREELRQRLWHSDTFVDFDNSLSTAINKIREALGDSAEEPRFVETLPRRGYRFIAPVEGRRNGLRSFSAPETGVERSGSAFRIWVPMAAGVLVLALAGAAYLARRSFRPRLTNKDTIVLADFANSTGDPAFDGTLKEALSVGLQQSSFLNILSEQRVRQTLRSMDRAPADHLNQETAREVCLRTGSTAVVAGSIARLGSLYVITLRATNCSNGGSLVHEQMRAVHKEEVLKALDDATTKLREELGESLSTIEKSDFLQYGTTSSLEALKAYTLGFNAAAEKGPVASIPFLKRAIELDPNFALAYLVLGGTYIDIGESGLAAENIEKAYQLRDRVSDYERLAISTEYYFRVTGEIEKAVNIGELWTETYQRAPGPHNFLVFIYESLGQYDKAIAENVESLSLESQARLPPAGFQYSSLVKDYAALDRLAKAKLMYRQAVERKLDGPWAHAGMYGVAFLGGDGGEMRRQLEWAMGRPGVDDLFSSLEADTQAFSGHLQAAREFSRRAVESARRNDQRETAALWQMKAALQEAEFGNSERTRQDTAAALALASTRDVHILAALALARIGDYSRAHALAENLKKRFPSDTFINSYWLPTILASNALHRGKPDEAIRILEVTAPYELGCPNPQFGGSMYPVYVRGQAYLVLHHGNRAAAEFTKFRAHRGIVFNSPLGALAQLGIARAYTLQGDKANARKAYQDFLALWKDADANIPILWRAKAEYAKLQ